MADLIYSDYVGVVINVIDDPVVALAEAIAVVVAR